MTTETEQLIVLLEARIRDFERNMAKANATAQKEFGAIERRGAQSAKKMQGLFSEAGSAIKSSLSGLSGGFLAGGLVGLISEQTVRALGDMVKSVADMADEAARVGLGVEDFQALSFAARQSGVEADKVTDLFQKFNLELGEAVAKGNDLSRILEANGIPLLDANGKLRDQKTLFYAIVDLIKNAKTQQDAAVISMAAFGKGAADALPFLQSGSKAIKDGEQAARDTGAVISKDLVEKAAAFDDAWTAIWDTWTAKGKSAVLEVMGEIETLWGKLDTLVSKSGITSDNLRGNALVPGLNDQQLAELEWLFPSLKPTDATRATALQTELLDLTAQRVELEQKIADAQAAGAAPIELQEYQDRLDLVLAKLEEARKKLEAIKALQGPAFEKTGRGTPNMPAAPATVVPQKLDSAGDNLTGSARDLEQAAAALEAAANHVGTGLMPGQAGPMDPRQLLSFTEAAKRGVLELIAAAEGTGTNGYNVSLAHGAFLPGGQEQNLSAMTLDAIDRLQSFMLEHPANTFNSSALGKYQITRTTLRDLRAQLGLSGDQLYTPELQDRLAMQLYQQRGFQPWEGMKRVGDADRTTAITASTMALNAQKQATDSLVQSQRQENASLQLEARSMGMSTFAAARMRKEAELLNQAKQAGIPITDQVKSGISTLADEYAKGQVAIENARAAQDTAAQASQRLQATQQQTAQAFEGAFGGATKGFISDLMHGVDAATALQNALTNLADQLMSMAVDNLFAGLFGGMGGSKKGLSGGGLFSYFGLADGGEAGRDGKPMVRRFASGGHVSGPGGPRDDKIPAMLSNGEFVVRADQASKHRDLLDAINSGRIPKFADGGSVGKPKLASAPAAMDASTALAVTNNITVNGANGSDQKANHELAKQISREVENSVRGMVTKELMAQRRPGNMLGR